MGLKDIIRAIREHPAVRAELASTRFELRQAQRELEENELDREWLSHALLEEKNSTAFLSSKAGAFKDALAEFCPRLSSPEELKRLYDTISPSLDASGFTLYRMAKELTGIDVPSYFPYEDNLGMFEKMEGRQLLDWLTAAYFQAVEWEIVPGTSYERASLREVDTSTPEYLAFEAKLYRKVLRRMGFGIILTPEQEVIQARELKLYSPLFAELFEADPETEPGCGSQILTGEDLTGFQTVIRQGIEDEQLPDEAERGLMTYFYGSKAVDEKVLSVFVDVENVDGKLYGVAVCRVKGSLSPGELEELKEFCIGQYSDAWGEGYEQRPRKTDYGDLYVSFWEPDGFFIRTKEELETARVPVRSPRGGDVR